MAITVNDFLVEHAPVIGNDINQKMLEQPTPWINLYSQEFWEDEKSSDQKTYTFDRPIVVDSSGAEAEPVDWADMASVASNTNNGAWSQADYSEANGNAGGVPPADYLKYTQTIRDFNLQHKAIWGPPMNTNVLRDKFQRVKQVDATVKAMAEQEREFWVERKRDEYTRVADNLVVLDSAFSLDGGDYGSSGFPGYSGTDASILTAGFLDEIYEYMNLHGAAKGCMGYADNRPVYGLVTSARQGRRLIHADPDIREDFRYSSQNEKLLAAMGVKYTYNGWTNLSDDMIRRFEYVSEGTAYVTVAAPLSAAVDGILTFSTAPTSNLAALSNSLPRVYKGSQIISAAGDKYIVTKYINAQTCYVRTATGAPVTAKTATTAGYKLWARIPQFVVSNGKRIPNPKWLRGTWEDSYIFHQSTCTSLVPRPITSVGKANFAAINYAGEVKWTMYDDKENNPDSTIGQFRCVMANGTRPDNPEFGIVIRHLAVPQPAGRIIGEDSLG